MHTFCNNGKGDPLIYAQEEEEEQEDTATQINALINLESNAIDALAD